MAVIDFSSPSGPVMSSPRSRAALTSSAIAARSRADALDDDVLFLASLGIALTPLIVSVISDQPSRQQLLTCQARNTVWRTVPYKGPVVAIVNANTFSCGDLFAAGIADHGIGRIVSIGEATGAGGANVWTSNDLEYAYHAARCPLPPIPPGISFTVSVRRMTRSGASAGLAVEDIGVSGDERYDMTQNDLTSGNTDLTDFCARLLAGLA